MANRDPGLSRRLVVNADDFGLSSSVNRAVIDAHRDGILTTASLMMNEPGSAEAIELAREHPRLGVGLHLTLLCGHSALAPEQIPGLVNQTGEFGRNPALVGVRYFFARSLHVQLQAELAAQFEKFRATGLPLDHVNGHLHLHLHPTILRLLLENARAWKISHVRLTWDPFWFNAGLARGRWFYRAGHALLYHILGGRARRLLDELAIKHTNVVFGLLQHAHVDEEYVTRLLTRLPPGNSELYSHPSLDEFKHEFDALVSPRTKALIKDEGIQLIRYQDL